MAVDPRQLLSCAQKNDAAGLQRLIGMGVDPSFGNDVGQTALHVACLWGNFDAAKALVEAKANVNAQNSFSGGTPLHCAAKDNSRGSDSGRKQCVELLVEAGANTDLIDFLQKKAYQYSRNDEVRAILRGTPWQADDDDDELFSHEQVPVTILTGFLGSGKTTLLNYILKANHGMKIAVVENEFGEVGVDDALIKMQDANFKDNEVVFDMANGCVCCTVRGDLIDIFKRLQRRKDRFDRIIVETTGLADPAPVCQTFFVDRAVRAYAKIDAVITVVDAKHIIQHLDEEKPDGVENEAIEQIAFADRVLLNKVDLSSEEELAAVEKRIRAINGGVQILRTQLRAAEGKEPSIDLDAILNVDAFNLQKILESEPDFLSDEGHVHEHDKSIGSIGFRVAAEMNVGKLNGWIQNLMQEKGIDLYRYKGVLAVKGIQRKFVFQGVHMIFDGDFTEPWNPDEIRESRFCFIGKNLDRAKITSEFMACTVKETDSLRFALNQRVLCKILNSWVQGTVEQHWDEGQPYRVALDNGNNCLIPEDSSIFIKAVE